MQALQVSVSQIPEQQKQQLDVLRQSWLTAVQARSKSGQLNLQHVASWLSELGHNNDHPRQQVYPYTCMLHLDPYIECCCYIVARRAFPVAELYILC